MPGAHVLSMFEAEFCEAMTMLNLTEELAEDQQFSQYGKAPTCCSTQQVGPVGIADAAYST